MPTKKQPSSTPSETVGNPYTNRGCGRTKHSATPSASKGCITLYASSSGSGRQPSRLVAFRLPLNVYVLLRENAVNVSGLLRRLVYEFLEKLPSYLEMEEFRLELEVARLSEELERVHRLQRQILKHGSYAEAYLKELRGGLVVDRQPFYVQKPRPEVKPEELLTVQAIVEYREALAKQLVRKVNRLLQLKKANLNLKGGEKTL